MDTFYSNLLDEILLTIGRWMGRRTCLIELGRTTGVMALALVGVPASLGADNRVLLHEFVGEKSGDNFGWVSSPVADVDGDGAPDVVVTSPFNDAGGANAGRVYMYSGKTSVELWRFTNDGVGEAAGFSVRDAGDIDGDEVSDVIAGGPSAGTGRAFVLSGVDGQVILTLEGVGIGDRFGSGVCGVGDINGDKVNDLAVGAENNQEAFGSAGGRLYFLSGVDGSVIATIDAEVAADKFGHSLANVGDLDEDGVDDVVVGAPNGNGATTGRAYVYSGRTRELLLTLDPTGTSASAFSQFFVATPGDVNKDGTNDIYVSDFGDTTNGGGAGKAYVFSGEDGAVLHEWLGQPGDGFGIGRGCGDVNGDGHADLLLAGWSHDNGAPNAGQATVFSGASGEVIRTFTSVIAGEGFGFDAHGLGDTNDDGKLDFFVTAAYNGEVGSRAGKCYLISGGLTTQPFYPGFAGRVNSVLVNGATPSAVVYLVGGLKLGSTRVPKCGGVTVGIRRPIILGKGQGNALGQISYLIDVPLGIRGKTVHVQAVELSSCGVSNLESFVFPQ